VQRDSAALQTRDRYALGVLDDSGSAVHPKRVADAVNALLRAARRPGNANSGLAAVGREWSSSK